MFKMPLPALGRLKCIHRRRNMAHHGQPALLGDLRDGHQHFAGETLVNLNKIRLQLHGLLSPFARFIHGLKGNRAGHGHAARDHPVRFSPQIQYGGVKPRPGNDFLLKHLALRQYPIRRIIPDIVHRGDAFIDKQRRHPSPKVHVKILQPWDHELSLGIDDLGAGRNVREVARANFLDTVPLNDDDRVRNGCPAISVNQRPASDYQRLLRVGSNAPRHQRHEQYGFGSVVSHRLLLHSWQRIGSL